MNQQQKETPAVGAAEKKTQRHGRGTPRGKTAAGAKAPQNKAAASGGQKQPARKVGRPAQNTAAKPAKSGAGGQAAPGKNTARNTGGKPAARQQKPAQSTQPSYIEAAMQDDAYRRAHQAGAGVQQSPRRPGANSAARENTAATPARKAGKTPSFYAPRAQQPGKKAPVLKWYPLGGLGEIGKNMNVYECDGDMVLLDCGSLFPDSDMFGVDLVIPDYTFLEQNRGKLKGMVITHGHEDHIGGLPYFLREFNIPVYATRLTIGLIENKLEEHGLRSGADLHLIQPREKFQIGCFTFEGLNVNHSIPDAVAYAAECPAGTFIHTGDFKIDYTPAGGNVIDLTAFAEYGKKGVLALFSDSTNSERPGMSVSESKVNESMAALFNHASADKKRVIVATFASNLYRVQLIADLAMQRGRKVAISGRSMLNNTQMARELGYLKIPDSVLIDVAEVNKYPPEEVVLITTGSQGEALSALSRMAAGSHRNVQVGPGDFIIISATPIPGNEKMVTRVVNGLLRLGADVIYERMYEVHASGHACQDEQKLILDLVRPQFFAPVHGEYKHMKRHAQTANAMGVPRANILLADCGDTVLISQDGARIGESFPAGAVMVDGLGVGDVGSVVLRDRRLLAQDGIVVLSATVDSATGQLLSGPELFSRGFVYVRDSEELLEETRLAVLQVLEAAADAPYRDVGSLKTQVREAAATLLYRRTKRNPMILPIIMEA